MNDSKSKVGEIKEQSQVSSKKVENKTTPKLLYKLDNVDDRKRAFEQILSKAEDTVLSQRLNLNPLNIIN